MSTSKAPPDTTFRDARPGAEAKRTAMLARARRELAAQPLKVRRVFVNRVSVAAAGCTLGIGGFVTAVAVSAPDVYLRLASFLPGTRPAVGASALATTFIATLLVYFIARAAAESKFTKAMLSAANPSDDLFDDLERLGQTPTRVAIRLAQRAALPARLGFTIGVGAIAAPVAAATHAVMARGGWTNPGAIDIMMFPIGPAMLNAVLCSVVVSARARASVASAPHRYDHRRYWPADRTAWDRIANLGRHVVWRRIRTGGLGNGCSSPTAGAQTAGVLETALTA